MPRHFSDWLNAYLRYQANSESPDSFHFWSGVSAIAGALRRKTWFDLNLTQKFLYTPNHYIVLVAPPGIARKSTAMGNAMSILAEVPGINFGPDSGTWQGLVERMKAVQAVWELDDGELETSEVTMSVSELGSFIDAENKTGQLDILSDLWDTKMDSWVRELKSNEEADVIKRPWINLISCVTPGWIARNIDKTFHEQGLASRIIFIYADKGKKEILYPGREGGDAKQQKKFKNQLVEDLYEIASLKGEFKVTDEATEFAESWYHHHLRATHKHLPGDKFNAYLSRKQDHLHKLSMVISAARRNTMVIHPEDFKEALEWLYEAEKMMPMVYGEMNKDILAAKGGEILQVLQKYGKMKNGQLYNIFRKEIGHKNYISVIEALEFAGRIRASGRLNDKETHITYTPEGK